MTDTVDETAGAPAPKKRGGGLSSMLIADLKAMAGGLGIAGAGSMKKAQLVEAIKAAQSGGQSGGQSGNRSEGPATGAVRTRRRGERAGSSAGREDAAAEEPADKTADKPADKPAEKPADTSAEQSKEQAKEQARDRGRDRAKDQAKDQADEGRQQRGNQQGNQQGGQQRGNQGNQGNQQGNQGNQQGNQGNQQGNQGNQQGNQGNQQPNQQRGNQQNASQQGNQQGNQQQDGQPGEDGEEGGGRRNRRRRQRDRERNRPAGATRGEPDTTVLDDDVLVPAAGILDVLDNYAFVRTSGYLPGPDDVYLSLSLVRKFGLRRGDAVVGQVRQPREGERKEKFDPMVRIDAVNGADPEAAADRPDFERLTPVYPTERLRLETGAEDLLGRTVDLVAPIGKGQRALVVAPPKAGKTTVLRAVAAAVGANHPECHLMVVLVDERPEEVTDVVRAVDGEVIASTFDRPAADQTAVAELAVERAKRLVELGHDVVVLLDGLTRLGRAYNLASPASGRILAGGVDSAALHPPKRLFGAARKVEGGGSLTIVATALVESGSRTDEVILEEFAGTENMELRLSGDAADRGLLPAVDVLASGTRREELLLGEQEAALVAALRGGLAGLERRPALERLRERLAATRSNVELLRQVQAGS